MPAVPAIVDFLVDWSITSLILAAAVTAVAVLAGSFGLAWAWRRWKERRRARRAHAARPPAPTGVGFAQRAAVHKLPKPSLPRRRGKE